MNTLLKNNAAAAHIGMSPPAFAKAVRNGRFSVAGYDKNGNRLFDPEVIGAEHEATKKLAEQQNHARFLPKKLQGGRPKKKNLAQTDLFDAAEITNNTQTQIGCGEIPINIEDELLRVKLAKEQAQAELLEIKLKLQHGEVIHKTEVQRQGIELGEIMLGAITSWPPRIAQELEAMGKRGCDGHDFQNRLIEECNNLIIEIRKRCGYGGNAND